MSIFIKIGDRYVNPEQITWFKVRFKRYIPDTPNPEGYERYNTLALLDYQLSDGTEAKGVEFGRYYGNNNEPQIEYEIFCKMMGR